MTGKLSDQLEPMVPITLHGFQGQECQVEAIVDTGFNDYLALPPTLITRLSLEEAGTVEVVLANGFRHQSRYFPVQVDWFGERRFVMAQEAASEALIGMSLLLGCRLCIDVVHAGPVEIAPHGGELG